MSGGAVDLLAPALCLGNITQRLEGKIVIFKGARTGRGDKNNTLANSRNSKGNSSASACARRCQPEEVVLRAARITALPFIGCSVGLVDWLGRA